MRHSILLFLCFLPLAIFAQEKKDLSQDEILTDKDYIALKAETTPFEAKLNDIRNEYQQATPDKKNDPTYRTSIDNRYSDVAKELVSILCSFISNHPDSYISLLVLKDLSDPNSGVDSPTLAGLYKNLSDSIKETDFGNSLGLQIHSNSRTAIGSIAPDFTQNDPAGKPVNLSDFRGNYLLIDFWASWCAPCRMENPNLVEAYAQFKDKNFKILGVSLDIPNSKSAWIRAIESDELTWTQVSDLQGWKNQAAQLYGVQTIPQNFLIDPKGVIIAKNLRGDDLVLTLSNILK